ncbi:expressed unknown protein [Seminavis robusta]|uniref:Uncharacterized protein n=1 Tax=Seminavis robusta TaxID=568900 RepID=A0A9N8F3L5_9STRA|nr:expressed unknown protein [Seminavis robusta]|eukprot:Sro3506_g348700.1 n/a (528) ;mRNA; r:2429-4012
MAVHVHCAEEHYDQVLSLLSNIYAPGRRSGYPQHKKLQVVPDRGSHKYLATQDATLDQVFTSLVDKQFVIVDNIQVIYIENVVGNPGPLSPQDPSTLYLAVTSMVDSNSNRPKQPVFIGLDQSTKDPSIWLLPVDKYRYAEALALSQRFGHATTKHWGPSAWNWFTPSFRQKQEDAFKYNPETEVFETRADRHLKRLANTKQFKREFEVVDNLDFVTECQIASIHFRVPGAFRERSAADGVALDPSEASSIGTTADGDRLDISTLNSGFQSGDYAAMWSEEESEESESMTLEDEENNEEDEPPQDGPSVFLMETDADRIHTGDMQVNLSPEVDALVETRFKIIWERVIQQDQWTLWEREDNLLYLKAFLTHKVGGQNLAGATAILDHFEAHKTPVQTILHLTSWELAKLMYVEGSQTCFIPISSSKYSNDLYFQVKTQINQSWLGQHPCNPSPATFPGFLQLLPLMSHSQGTIGVNLWNKALFSRQVSDFQTFYNHVHTWWLNHINDTADFAFTKRVVQQRLVDRTK